MPNEGIMISEDIKKIFLAEFSPLKEKFIIYNLSVDDAREPDETFVWHPSVYVWFHETDGVIRVGRSLDNSRKRALQHIKENTGGKIIGYSKDVRTKIILFNVIHTQDYHWAASLEIYFEDKLNPKIAARRG
jgi:hypothetical protein